MASINKGNKQIPVEGEIFIAQNTINVEFKNSDAKKSWESLIFSHATNEMTRPLINIGTSAMKYMQYLIKEEKDVAEIAEHAFRSCGLYEYEKGQRAVVILAMIDCWKYGSQLSVWFKENFKD